MTDSTVRLPPIPPAELSDEQKPLYEDMKKGISSDFNAFQTMVQDGPAKGALIGPWNPWLHEPKIGREAPQRAAWLLPRRKILVV